MRLPYRDHTYLRLISSRTGETLFEAKMPCGSLTVWGSHYRPGESDARLARGGQTVALAGTLRDRIDPVVTLGDVLDVLASFSVEVGDLPPDYDPSWKRKTVVR